MQSNNEQDTMVMENLPSPFADTSIQREAEPYQELPEMEDASLPSPFTATMGSTPIPISDPRSAARTELSAALHSQEFNEVLYNMAGELMERRDPRQTGSQFEVGDTSASLAQQSYLNQLLEASDALINQVHSHFEDTPASTMTN